jgi:catecholate siderophore receptor
MHPMPYCKRFVSILAICLLCAPRAHAKPVTFDFDIPAGPLPAAIAGFERIAGARVDVPGGADLSGFTTGGVKGRLAAADALTKLLDGSGFTFRATATAFVLQIATSKLRVEVVGRSHSYVAADSATATKVPTPLKDVPQTLTIVPRTVLVDQNAQSVGDAARNAPGVTIHQGEGNRDQLVFRGISSQSDFFVNGIRDDQERFRDLYNVESVEIVEGPAAVLFGRGGAGGLVNLVTRQPSRTAPSSISVEAGGFAHKRATAQLTVPAGARAVFGLSAMGEDSGGFRDGFFLRRHGVNPTFGLELGPRTRLVLGVEHLRDHRLADRGIPSLDGRPLEVRSGQLFGSAAQNDARSGVDSASGTVEHVFRNGVTLRNHVLAGRYDKFYQNVFPGSAVGTTRTLTLSAYNHGIDRTNVFNQTDIIARGRTGRVNHVFVAGLEVGRQFQDELRHTAAAIANVPVSDPVRDADFAAAPLVIDRHATANVLAGYVHDQVQLSPQWKAVGGARVDRFAVLVDSHLGSGSTLSRADTAVSPRVGLIYQPSGRVSLYTSYASTFLPSGQTLGLAVNTTELGPENARNYEAGAKLDLVPRRLQLSAAMFRLDRNNVKNTDPNDPTRLVLTGRQRAEGLTMSAAGDAGCFRLEAAYANIHARVTRDTAAARAGQRAGLVPRHRGSVWVTADLLGGWGAGGGITAQSKAFTSFTNQVVLPAFARVDALVYYCVRGWRVALNVDNLFNATYYPTANGDNNISPGAPRSLQVSLRLGF